MTGTSGKKATAFRVGRVRAFLRGRVWYLCYRENGKRKQPRVGPEREIARQMAAEINAQLEVGIPSSLGFEPIAIADLRTRWLDQHEHVRRQVLRGKRDLARRGFWPGGSPPFGYRLVSRMSERDGRQFIEDSILQPHPEEAPLIQKLFERANATGHGPGRLAKSLNADPEIPEKFKPFYGSTVRHWLEQEIYFGDLVWEQNATDIVDDARVIEPNAEADWLHVPNFCEPLISRELWDQVAAVRLRRSRKANASKNSENGKLIRPLAPGLSLTYFLSGLVRCGECHAAMRPV